MNDLNLSIVIPAYHFHDPYRVIRSLLPINPLEIIVVDSSPTPASLPEDSRIQLIHLSQRSWPGEARNVGWKKARGEYILFVDADVEFTEKTRHFVSHYLKNQADSKQRKDEMCFGIYATKVASYNSITQVVTAVQRYRFQDEFAKHNNHYGQSSHMIIRKDMAQRTGYFNPCLRMHEDKELCIRAASLGISIIMYPEFEANHLKVFSLKSLLRDHLDKSYLAVKCTKNFPAIFNRVTQQMATKYKITWLAACLIPLLTMGLWIEGVLNFSVGVMILMINCLLPLFICTEVFERLNMKNKLTALWLWPFMGAAMAVGASVALLEYLYQSMRNSIIGFWNLSRMGIRVLWRNGMPINIVHFITSRCNLRCNHCFYKETLDAKDPGEQSLQQFDKTTSEIGPVLWYAIAGGEPYIRRDIVELVKIIRRNCKPLMVTIPTNGWYIEKVLLKTLEMLQQMPGKQITIQFSLDGPQQMHDKIRSEDSWRRAETTFQKLKQLQQLYPNLSLAIITVVNEENYHCYPDFIDELVNTFRPNQIAINLFRHTTVSGPPTPDKVIDAYKAAVERYEWHIGQKNLNKLSYVFGKIMRIKEILQKELIYRVVRYNEFVTPCTAGTLNYVIWENGDVSPCEILGKSVGNILGEKEEHHFKNIVHSKKAKLLRRWIKDEKCKCSYECAMTVNTLFSWPMTRKMLKKLGLSIFGVKLN